MSNDTAGESPKPRSFADAAALLPSVVPVPRIEPAEAVPRATPAALPGPVAAGPAPLPVSEAIPSRVGIFAAAFPPGAKFSPPIGPDGLLAGLATFMRRRAWVLAVLPAAAAGFAAWHGIGNGPVAAGNFTPATRAAAPSGTGMSEAAPQPGAGIGTPQAAPAAPARQSAAEPSPAQPAATPAGKTVAGSPLAAAPDAVPVPYSLIVLHPRPASAAGDAANGRITALLQPLAARLEVQKPAGTKGRLTVHYFHDEDADAARALADTVRTPGSRVHVRGPVRTSPPWPRNAFEVWLRGP